MLCDAIWRDLLQARHESSFYKNLRITNKAWASTSKGRRADLAKNERVLGRIAELLPLQVIRPMEFVTKIERNLPMPVLLG
jgi:hypothetical protein